MMMMMYVCVGGEARAVQPKQDILPHMPERYANTMLGVAIDVVNVEAVRSILTYHHRAIDWSYASVESNLTARNTSITEAAAAPAVAVTTITIASSSPSSSSSSSSATQRYGSWLERVLCCDRVWMHRGHSVATIVTLLLNHHITYPTHPFRCMRLNTLVHVSHHHRYVGATKQLPAIDNDHNDNDASLISFIDKDIRNRLMSLMPGPRQGPFQRGARHRNILNQHMGRRDAPSRHPYRVIKQVTTRLAVAIIPHIIHDTFIIILMELKRRSLPPSTSTTSSSTTTISASRWSDSTIGRYLFASPLFDRQLLRLINATIGARSYTIALSLNDAR
jgi:hypothetical protein